MIFESAERKNGYHRRSRIGTNPNLFVMIGRIIVAERGTNGVGAVYFAVFQACDGSS
jgi:hypothetical protein